MMKLQSTRFDVLSGRVLSCTVIYGQCDARPTVTFPSAGHHRPLNATQLYCLVTHVHEQLAQGCCPKLERPGVEPATFCVASQHPNHRRSYRIACARCAHCRCSGPDLAGGRPGAQLNCGPLDGTPTTVIAKKCRSGN